MLDVLQQELGLVVEVTNAADITIDRRCCTSTNRYLTRGLGKMCDGRVNDVYAWPTCESHYEQLTDYTDFYSWVWKSMYKPHGTVHTWIGGILNCEETLGAVSALIGEENADALGLSAFDQRKNFWIDGFFECKGAANVGESTDEVRGGWGGGRREREIEAEKQSHRDRAP